MIGYLSGPITGHPNYRRTFGEAAAKLRALGYDIINPAEICETVPVDRMSYEDIMEIDLALLSLADCLVQLPGWETSKGANRELGFALGADKIVVAYEDMLGGRCNDIDRDV